MLLAKPGEPEVLTDLLVSRGDKDHVSGRDEAVPREGGDRDRARGHLALHIEGAAAPDLPVPQLTRPGVDRPLLRVGPHRVGMRDQGERRPAAAGQARDDVRPLGHPREELVLDSRALEIGAQELGGNRLVAGRVDSVGAQELLQELGGLVADADGRHPVSILPV